MGSESLGSMDNKALNRSVLTARVGQSPDGRNLPLYPATVFTNSILFDASVNAGVIQLGSMSQFSSQIERITGSPCPQALRDLVDSNLLRKLCPLTIRFADADWIFPVYEVSDPDDLTNYDTSSLRYRFARNDDGFALHIDLTTDRLEILLEEFGDVDTLDIGVSDLLDSIANGRYTRHEI